MKIALVVFRNDLRLLDNETILRANASKCTHLLPLYVLDKRYINLAFINGTVASVEDNAPTTRHFGFPRTHTHRTNFLLQSLDELRKGLKEKGSDLLVRQGTVEEIVGQIVKDAGNVTEVYMAKDVTSEEIAVENRIRELVDQNLNLFWTSTLYHTEDVPKVPDVFTQFRRSKFMGTT